MDNVTWKFLHLTDRSRGQPQDVVILSFIIRNIHLALVPFLALLLKSLELLVRRAVKVSSVMLMK